MTIDKIREALKDDITGQDLEGQQIATIPTYKVVDEMKLY